MSKEINEIDDIQSNLEMVTQTLIDGIKRTAEMVIPTAERQKKMFRGLRITYC